MRGKRRWAVAALLLVAATLVVPAVVLAGPDDAATARYGDEGVGTNFPPAEHDSSFHAYDKIRPRTVVISAGGSVDFKVDGFHQVAVYEPGVAPGDITVPPFGPPLDPNFDNIFIDDGDGLLFAGAPLTSLTSPAGAFDTPGTYLMICNVTPHFAFAKMYGWIIVK